MPLDEFDRKYISGHMKVTKPDPRIYELVCERLEISPSEAVFLDDIGRNLKSARALGMQTIKVDTPEQALRELSQLLDLELLD